MSDDVLGEREIDLTKQYYSESLEGTHWVQAVMLDCVRNGVVQGAIKLAFAKIPNVGGRPGEHEKARLSVAPREKQSFAGAMHVKVLKIEGFSDQAGAMGRNSQSPLALAV